MGDGEDNAPAQSESRLRVSIWAGTALIKPASVAKAEQIVDDISILNTVVHNIRAPGPDIGPLIGDFGSTNLGDVIHACHSLEIQCLAGYDCSGNDTPPGARSSPRGNRLTQWLRALESGSLKANKSQKIDDLVTDIVDNWINKEFPLSGGGTARFDGISFDIETLLDEAASDNWITFYQRVAQKLAGITSGSHADKFVGVANGGLVDDTSATTKGTGAAMPSAKRHRYNMVNGFSNLVLRPMCYDNFGIALDNPADRNVDRTSPPPAHVTSVPQIFKWHDDIIRYALTVSPTPGQANAPGVLTGQFQVGIKNFPGSSNVPLKVFKTNSSGQKVDASGNPTTDPAKFVFDHWETAGRIGGYLSSAADIRRRCREMRTAGVGLILFAMTSSSNQADIDLFWRNVATYNWVLNKSGGPPPAAFDTDPTSKGDPDYDPSNPSAGTNLPAIQSQPRQWPLTAAAQKRMEDS